jgi:benzoate/toluate 1,2-dioxygenase alpha subunit
MQGVISAGVRNEDEGLYPVQHGFWLETMRTALAKEHATRTEN